MAGLSPLTVMKICQTNLVELKFTRRDKTRKPTSRRMLCTLDRKLLNSVFGKETLNFKKPKNPPPYNAIKKNLATVWDIMMQDWRNVSCEGCEIVSVIPTTPMAKFLKYFVDVILQMSPAQKKGFMDK